MPVVDLKQTGKNIDILMENRGMTAKDVQVACGLGSTYAVYKWLNGMNLPTVDNLVILASLFGVSLDHLVATK